MAYDDLIPKLIEAGLLGPLEQQQVLTQSIVSNRNYEGAIQQFGDSVTVNTVSAVAISDYDESTGVDYKDLVTTSKKLKIDQQKYWAFPVGDITAVQIAGVLQDPAITAAGQGLANAAEKHAAKKLADSAKALPQAMVFNGAQYYTPKTGQITAWDVLINIVTELDKMNVPIGARWLAVGPSFASALLSDPRVTQANKAGTDAVLRTGQLAAIEQLGLTVLKSNNMPTDSAAGTETIIAGPNGALSFAQQLLKTESLRDPKKFATNYRGLYVYGAEVMRSDVTIKCDVKVEGGVLK